MSNLNPGSEERLRLLAELFLNEQQERNTLAQNLHQTTGGIAAMNIWFSLLENKIGKRNKTLKMLKEVLGASVEDFKNITTEIYPRTVFRQGLMNALKEYAGKCMQDYDIEIVLLKIIEEQLKIDPKQEVEVYKLCKNIIDSLRLVFCSRIELRFSVSGETCQVKISGKGALKETFKNPEQIKRFRLIKARLLLLDAVILPKTNWKTHMEFDFKMLREKE